jgi:SAM-dependent methyltransferase
VNEERARRAASFSAVAEAYERARPGYPEEAVRWLAGEPPLDVVDLAAGTGKLTRVLVGLGHRVTAVEPLAEMREQLQEAVRGVRAVEGGAEAMPLPDASADAVVAAQAYHWFDHPVALPEIARVLRPGGRLGVIWNLRDESVDWVARLSELIDSEGDKDRDDADGIAASGLYGEAEEAEWRWEQRLDRGRLRDLVLSRSYCATMTPEGREPVLAAVDELYDEVAGPEGLLMPYVTYALRVAKR